MDTQRQPHLTLVKPVTELKTYSLRPRSIEATPKHSTPEAIKIYNYYLNDSPTWRLMIRKNKLRWSDMKSVPSKLYRQPKWPGGTHPPQSVTHMTAASNWKIIDGIGLDCTILLRVNGTWVEWAKIRDSPNLSLTIDNYTTALKGYISSSNIEAGSNITILNGRQISHPHQTQLRLQNRGNHTLYTSDTTCIDGSNARLRAQFINTAGRSVPGVGCTTTPAPAT